MYGADARRRCAATAATGRSGDAGGDTTDPAQDLGHLTTLLEVLGGAGAVAALADQVETGDTPVQGRVEIVDPGASWRVGFPLVKGKAGLVPGTAYDRRSAEANAGHPESA